MSEEQNFLLMFSDTTSPRTHVDEWASPDDLAAQKALPDNPSPMTEDQLIKDEGFQGLAEYIYNRMYKEGETTNVPVFNMWLPLVQRPPVEKGEDQAKWLVNQYAWFNNNLPRMLTDYVKLGKVPMPLLKAWYEGWSLYEETPITKKQFARGAGMMATDITSFLGFTAIAKQAANNVAKWRIKSQLKNIVEKGLRSGTFQGAVEGTAYASAFGHAAEGVRSKAKEEDYDVKRVMNPYAMIGLGFGTSIGAAVDLVPKGWRHLKPLGEKIRDIKPTWGGLK